MIDLYGMTSPNVLKLALMLEECGLDYRVHHVDVFAGAQHDPAFLAMNPNAKVPVIVDNDGDGAFAVFESGAALLYLADKTGLLLPRDGRARSTALQWLLFQASTVGPAFGQYVHFFRYAPSEIYALRRHESETARVLGLLDRRLGESAWLSGDSYGLADIATWPGVRTGDAIFPLLANGHGWRTLPNLRRWFDNIAERSAAVRATAAVDALLPQDKAAFARADTDALDRFFGRGRHDHALALTGAEPA
ncbi:glutathione S-transferase family protein [Sphingomonas cavernae]|uniref:Glutathione S-transferase n=1 Tax=Sphingomonas cavernae TaxID=2320861 RepID=A0A418WPG8_9SPHN|nr:glutathione S-transferase N-terminal domain-containing protein [Sphingomonas cavernae]RJF93126.1 glutathione S-transferase [Sphingomonas cavernae]